MCWILWWPTRMLSLWNWVLHVFLFFFFQAEDGIRDVAVTGVQTCALPISGLCSRLAGLLLQPLTGDAHALLLVGVGRTQRAHIRGNLADLAFVRAAHDDVRSEERRVGKECRSRWSPYH